jgi:hypothetical protein
MNTLYERTHAEQPDKLRQTWGTQRHRTSKQRIGGRFVLNREHLSDVQMWYRYF